MSTVTMTMLEALNKKKQLEERLNAFPSNNPYVTYISELQLSKRSLKVDEIEATLRSNFMSKQHLIKNIAEIKSKINESNAITKITVAGKEYTIADAIARHRAIETEKKFWAECYKQYNATIMKIEELNYDVADPEKVNRNISTLISGFSKMTTEQIDDLKELYIKENTFKIIDPNNLKNIIEDWKNEIDNFEALLHGAMIESNVKTTITCEFED